MPLLLSNDNQKPEYNISSVEFFAGDENFWLIKGKYIDEYPHDVISVHVEHQDEVQGIWRGNSNVSRDGLNEQGEFEIKIPVPDGFVNSDVKFIDQLIVSDAYGNRVDANESSLNSINALTETRTFYENPGDVIVDKLSDVSINSLIMITTQAPSIIGMSMKIISPI